MKDDSQTEGVSSNKEEMRIKLFWIEEVLQREKTVIPQLVNR